jgi:hypothetical protein
LIAIREATAADRDAILSLRARCFPHDDPEKRDPRFWEWEFRGGRMFIAEEHGRAVAHLGFVAQTCIVNGARVHNLLAVDAMTDPDYRRRKLFGEVAKFASDAIANAAACSTAWQIRDAVLAGMTAGGWQVIDDARVLIRPLFAFRTLSRGDGMPTRDVRAMSSIAREFFTGPCVDRSPEHLQWRYFDNPLWHYEVIATDNAWLATRRTKLKGYDTLAIADIAWRNGRASEAGALLTRALRNTRTPLAATLVTRAHPAYWFFVKRGFVPGPHRFRLLMRTFSLDARLRWQLAWGDTDHL